MVADVPAVMPNAANLPNWSAAGFRRVPSFQSGVEGV